MNGSSAALRVLFSCLMAAFADPGLAHAARAQLVVGGLDQPVIVATPAGDARLFVVERGGRVRIVADGAVQEPPFLDIRDRVDTEREGGLTGLAFADDYAETGRFYVYYTYGTPGVADRAMESRISAFQGIGPPASASVADAAQEQVLWSLALPNTIHHRFSFDALTGDLYLGDVGQDAREEIDVLPAGFAPAQGCGDLPNYGWDVVEGSVCWGPDAAGEPACSSSCLIAPIHEYPHALVPGCSGAVTGGVVYRASALPDWQGRYVFGDFCSGRLFSLRWTPAAGAGDLVEHTSELFPAGGSPGRITGFGEGREGEVYFTSAGDFSPSGGRLYRIPEPAQHVRAWLSVSSIVALARTTGRLG